MIDDWVMRKLENFEGAGLISFVIGLVVCIPILSMFLVEIVWATDTARQLVDTVLLPLKLISFAEIVLAGGTALAMLAGAGLGIKAFYSGKKH